MASPFGKMPTTSVRFLISPLRRSIVILGIHSAAYLRADNVAKEVGFLWAPNWTILFMVLLPLFFAIVAELLAFWNGEARLKLWTWSHTST